jgi:uncharacterized protein YidB (DUF937 family)
MKFFKPAFWAIATLLLVPFVSIAEEKNTFVISEEQSKACEFVGPVNVSAYGWTVTKAQEAGLKKALKEASKLGGNAVVLKQIQQVGAGFIVSTDAFKCAETLKEIEKSS